MRPDVHDASSSRPVVALLESRMGTELVRLVEKHGGKPVCVPALRECADLTAETARELIDAFTDDRSLMCQIQFRHLYAAAEAAGIGAELVRVLNDRMLVGAVGPTCETTLRAYGVRAHVMPDHAKMGPLVFALMRALESRDRRLRSSASLSILPHPPSTSSS